MTHTLHRRGSEESLKNDYVIFAMTATGFNKKGSADALREFEAIVSGYDIANMGDMKTGGFYLVGRDKIMDNVVDTSIVHAVLTSKEDLCDCIRRVKEADLGVSVNVTGIIEDVEDACNACGIKRHTVEVSLGIRGDTELLPDEDLLQISTMCGHGMVATHLARKMLIDIKKGRISVEDASKLLATPCVCGVFNPKRAAAILTELLDCWCLDEG